MLKRTTEEYAGMTEAMTAVVGSVALVLQVAVAATKVRARNVREARAAGSKVLSLFLLLPMVRLARAPTPGEMLDLTAAITQLVGEKVVLMALVVECCASRVQTAPAESKEVHPSPVLR